MEYVYVIFLMVPLVIRKITSGKADSQAKEGKACWQGETSSNAKKGRRKSQVGQSRERREASARS